MSANGKKRGIPIFWPMMAVLVAVNAGVINYSLGLLWDALERYEATTPLASLTIYLSDISKGEFDRVMEDSGFSPSPLNTERDYQDYLTARFAGVSEPVLRMTSAQSEGWRQYLVFDGERELGPVWLTRDPGRGGWKIRSEYEYLPGTVITAPGHLEVFVSGRRLDEENCGLEFIEIPFFSMLEEDERPQLVRYHTEPTLYPQRVSVGAPDGAGTLLEPDDDTGGWQGWELLETQRLEELSGLMSGIAEVYSAFVTKDAEFARLSPYLYPGTQLYEGLGTFDNHWYIPHDSHSFGDVEISEVTLWSPTAFSGRIEFVGRVYMGNKVYEYPSAYYMAFLKSEGEWKLLNMQVA